MTKGLDSKILYSLLIVSGFVLTIGAASAVVMYSENIELDNGTGDSSIKVTSATGNSKLIIEDQGRSAFSISTVDGKSKIYFSGESSSTPFMTINKWGQVGIATKYPTAKLDVNGNMHVKHDVDFDKNLNVDGVITGSFIANLEATIAANEATIADLLSRVAALEGTTVPMVVSNEAMIATHDTTLATHDTMILTNQADIATNAAAIAEGGGGPNPCNPDGDGSITAQEMFDYMISIGFTNISVTVVENLINNVENSIFQNPNVNGVVDSDAEITKFNTDYFISAGLSPCPLI